MRLFVILLAIVVSGSAQAQFPYNYAPYTPRQYDPPAQGRSSVPMAQEMLDAHNAIRARVGVPPLVWSHQLAKSRKSGLTIWLLRAPCPTAPTTAMARTSTQ